MCSGMNSDAVTLRTQFPIQYQRAGGQTDTTHIPVRLVALGADESRPADALSAANRTVHASDCAGIYGLGEAPIKS